MGVYCIFDRADGLYTAGSSGPIDYDDASHVALVMAAYPDRRSRRWDGAGGLRDATAEELADFDDAACNESATATLGTPLNKVLQVLYFDIEKRLRLAGRDSTLPDIAAATNKAEYTAALKERVKALS